MRLCRAAVLWLAIPALAQTWEPLFDGVSLSGWKETPFPRRPPVRVEKGTIVLPNGAPLTGITYTKPFPKDGYELRFEAMRRNGGDFFASVTFPAGETFATLVTGGWGGDIVGISSIDGWDASDNETRTYFTFEPERWYVIRLRVTRERLQAWIDDAPVVDVRIAGRTISLRPGDIGLSTPLGIASYNTTGVLRKIEYRLLSR